jgi:glucosamine--fructose-6-phosphate aminotransferase (isomerizing)
VSTGSHLEREIHEQPAVLERLLRSQGPVVAELAEKMTARGISHVVIAARGTSDNAGRYAQYLLGAMNGIVVTLAAPSLFTAYQRPPRLGNALVLGISQSGKSPDLAAVLAEARRQGSLTAVLTNTPGSDLAKLGEVVIDLLAGPENAVAATKTYTAELGALAMLSASLAASREMQEVLDRVPEAMALALDTDRAASEAASTLNEARHMAVLGRGFNYATAFELSLKLTELTYTNAVAYSSADFRHGPLAMVEQGFPVLVLAASGALLEDMRSTLALLADRRAEVLCISDDPSLASNVRLPLTLPRSVPEWLSPLPMIVPGQLLAMHLAALRGYDVDAPRAITKITETY